MSPSRTRRVQLGIGGLGICALAVVVVLVIALDDRGSEGVGRQDVLAFEEALDPLAYEGGRIVVQGLRAGIADLYYGDRSGAEVAAMAEGWRNELMTLRDDLNQLPAPGTLGEVVRKFDLAMQAYIATASEIIDTANASEGDRRQALEAVGRTGERADELWEEARRLLLQQRDRLGITEPSPLE